MQQRWFETTHGAVPLWGLFDEFRPERPAVFAIRGAFSEPTVLYRLAGWRPDVDFVFAHLPGMHSPHIADPSVEAFTAALEQAAHQALPARSFSVLGNSIGGLVALGFRQAHAIIALEPPLLTAGLWPMRPLLLDQSNSGPDMAAWVWAVFGFGADGVTAAPRDYRGLLERLSAPTCAILGGDPLEPERPFDRLPSLVSQEAREALPRRARTITVTGVGHNIPRDAEPVLLDALAKAAPRSQRAQA